VTRRADTRWAHRLATLKVHPRLLDLTRELGPAAEAALLALWAWASLNRPDGYLGGLTAPELARHAEWKRGAVVFVAALRRHGFVDDGQRLVDWHSPATSTQRSNRSRQRHRVATFTASKESTATPTSTAAAHRARPATAPLLVSCGRCGLPLTLLAGERAPTTCARCATNPDAPAALSGDALQGCILEIVRTARRIRLLDLGAKLQGQPPEAVNRALSALLGGQRLRKLGEDVYELGSRAMKRGA
jgi:hypothetical protein